MPKVTVIIPSYNHAEWIGEAIESALEQTLQDFEVIIHDDGSTDNSAEVIKAYAAKDERISYTIADKNVGAVHVINKMISSAKGEFIAMLSADDVWQPNTLERLMHEFEKQPTLGAVFALPQYANAEGKPFEPKRNYFLPSLKPQTRGQWLRQFFDEGNSICHTAMLIRKSSYDKVGVYNPVLRALPDFDMWIRLFGEVDVKVIDEKLVMFRQHTFNESGQNTPIKMRAATEGKQIYSWWAKGIVTVAQLRDMFPEVEFEVDDNRLAQFYLARQALYTNRPALIGTAVDILYKELQKPEVYKLLEEHKLYSYRALSEDVVRYDVFGYAREKFFLNIFNVLTISKVQRGQKQTFRIMILGVTVFKINKVAKK